MAASRGRTLRRGSGAKPTSMWLVERQHIMQTLAFTVSQIESDRNAAALLGLTPSTLRSRMSKHGITRAAALLEGVPRILPTDWTLRAIHRQHISDVLAFANGRIEGPGGAAALLGLKPSTLRTRMALLRMRRPSRVDDVQAGERRGE